MLAQNSNKPELGNSVQGRLVAIDATVQRRPPGGLVSAEDAACNRLTELALNDVEVSLPYTSPRSSVSHPSVSGMVSLAVKLASILLGTNAWIQYGQIA